MTKEEEADLVVKLYLEGYSRQKLTHIIIPGHWVNTFPARRSLYNRSKKILEKRGVRIRTGAESGKLAWERRTGRPPKRPKPLSEIRRMKDALAMVVQTMKDVRSQLSNSHQDIDRDWCIDQLCGSINSIVKSGLLSTAPDGTSGSSPDGDQHGSCPSPSQLPPHPG